jgi:hypothetical protein
MKRIFKLLAFPVLAFLWMIGLICYVVGERKEEEKAADKAPSA